MLERLFPRLAAARQRRLAEFHRLSTLNAMLEGMPSWVSEPEEDQWTTVTPDKDYYSEDELRTLREQAAKLYYVSPAARGLVDVMVLFIMGRHASMAAEDEKAQRYWDEWAKANRWDDRARELIRRTFRSGEFFLRFFEPAGRADRYGTVRFVDPSEVTDHRNRHSYGIETDPEDVEKVLRYHRTFTHENGTQEHEVIDADDMVHEKVLVDSNVKRGVSWLIGMAKYVRAYEQWLDDRRYLNRIRTIFNLVMKPEGPMTPAALKAKFQDESRTPSGRTPSKRLPKRGSVLLAQGVDYEFKSLDLNASDTKDDGRAIERMISKATQLVEGVVTGDYSNQNYASSLVAESPMVKMVESWQDFFDGVFGRVFAKVIERAKNRGQLNEKVETQCSCNFATLVHRDLDKDTNAYQVHRQNEWASDKTISTKLGYDYDVEQEQIAKEDAGKEKKARSYDEPPEHPEGPEAG